MARRPGGGRRPRAADRARLRAERARRRRDGRPRRRPGRVAERARPDPRRQRPGAAPAHDRAGRPAGGAPRDRAGRPAPPGRPAARPVRPRLLAGHGGRRAWRVRAARRDRGRLPAVDAAADPDRVLRRRDRLAAGVRPDRPADGPHGRSDRAAAGVRVPAAGGRGSGHPRAARAAWRRACRSAWQPTSRGSRARPPRRSGRRGRRPALSPPRPIRRLAPSPSATPPRSGPPSSRRRPAWITSARARCFVLDEPGDIAEAAEFLWRQADERRAELIEAGDLPKDWPSTLPAAPRLEVPPRRLADAGADLGVRAAGRRGDGVGPPQLGRPVRLARARPAAGSRGPAARRGHDLDRRRRADRPRQRPVGRGWPTSSARPATRSVSSSGSWTRRPRAPSSSSSAASTAASKAARTAWSSSRIASCSGPCASVGPRRCGASCRATSSSG